MTLDQLIAARPNSLTAERARSFLPSYDIDPEWQAAHDIRETHAEPGTAGRFLEFLGMLRCTWPDEKPTVDEARWILALYEEGSQRWVAAIVLHGDGNQIFGSDLITAATNVMKESAGDDT